MESVVVADDSCMELLSQCPPPGCTTDCCPVDHHFPAVHEGPRRLVCCRLWGPVRRRPVSYSRPYSHVNAERLVVIDVECRRLTGQWHWWWSLELALQIDDD